MAVTESAPPSIIQIISRPTVDSLLDEVRAATDAKILCESAKVGLTFDVCNDGSIVKTDLARALYQIPAMRVP